MRGRQTNPVARREALRLLRALSRARRARDALLARAFERAIAARDAAAPVIPEQLDLKAQRRLDVPPRPDVCPECTSRPTDTFATLQCGTWVWRCQRCTYFGRLAKQVVEARLV